LIAMVTLKKLVVILLVGITILKIRKLIEDLHKNYITSGA